jgi:hypothetical protein
MIIYSVNLLAIIFVHTDVESIEKLNHHVGHKKKRHTGVTRLKIEIPGSS